MSSFFFTDFLMISTGKTIAFLAAIVAFFVIIYWLKGKLSFSGRVLIAMGMGLLLGLAIQFVAGFPAQPMDVEFIRESTKWYGLVGNGFLSLIRMLVIPLVMVSIVHVIINMKGVNLASLARNTIAVTMVMVTIAAIVGLSLGLTFNVGSGFSSEGGASQIKDVKPVADTFLSLLPDNPAQAMLDTNVIALVIFSAFFGAAALRMGQKYMDIVKPFYDLVNALHKIIVSVAMYVIRLMPYAVIAMLANTIAQRGLLSILEVLVFIGVLYLGVAVMFTIQLLALWLFGINPITYVRKGLETLVMAFVSRSSVGVLPMTISTLTQRMGASEATANFVASFGSTAGMQGCAGVFPALLVVFVANLNGMHMDAGFLVMAVIVIAIGSLGIAGIPGTATMAASVALSGTGMGSLFYLISPILAIDPLIDMPRTMLNVSGSMVNSLIVDKHMGLFNQQQYNNPEAKSLSGKGSLAIDA